MWGIVLGKLGNKSDIDNCSSADRKNKDASYVETDLESIPWQRADRSKVPHWMTSFGGGTPKESISRESQVGNDLC